METFKQKYTFDQRKYESTKVMKTHIKLNEIHKDKSLKDMKISMKLLV